MAVVSSGTKKTLHNMQTVPMMMNLYYIYLRNY